MARMNAMRLVLVRYARPPRGPRTKYIVAFSPNFHIGGIENSQKRKMPGDSINNDFLSFREELVDDGAQEEEVNQ